MLQLAKKSSGVFSHRGVICPVIRSVSLWGSSLVLPIAMRLGSVESLMKSTREEFGVARVTFSDAQNVLTDDRQRGPGASASHQPSKYPPSMQHHIFLVRHGQTSENKNKIVQGHLDTALDELGLQQARETAEYLSGQGVAFDVAWSSDLQRARKVSPCRSEEREGGTC